MTLICNRCGEAPPAGLPARAGGTHYRRLHRVSGPGRKPVDAARRCGTWIEASPVRVEVAEEPPRARMRVVMVEAEGDAGAVAAVLGGLLDAKK